MVCILNLYIAGFSATRKAVPSQTERKPDADSDWLKNTVPQPDPLQTQPNVFWKGACQWQVNSALPRNARTYIETSDAGQAKDCANLFRFLAFTGVRIDEARHVVWNDVEFEKGLATVRITKNGKDRWIPVNSSLRLLLEKMRAERPKESQDNPVMQVFECQESIDRVGKLVGVKRITLHDLRHLFAPTVDSTPRPPI